MSKAKFTLIGTYQYYHNAGGDLFELMDLPTGINKDTLCSNILLQGGEFEVQHGNPQFIHNAIGIWSKAWKDSFQRWVDALAIEYAPLENYDRMEHWTDEKDLTNNVDATGSSNSVGTADTTNTINSTVEDTINSTVENTKSAYDSNAYQPNEKNTTASTEVIDTDTTEVTDTDTTDRTNTTLSSDTVINDDNEHNGRIHGNIGVTTSQQMLNQELDLGYWNLYQRITQLFLQEFVIPVYE